MEVLAIVPKIPNKNLLQEKAKETDLILAYTNIDLYNQTVFFYGCNISAFFMMYKK